MVFHRRRSSHLFYTPYVFSQCQTRVKLNHEKPWPRCKISASVSTTDLRRGIYSSTSNGPPRLHAVGISPRSKLSLGISTSLKSAIAVGLRKPTDTFPRVTTVQRTELATGLPCEHVRSVRLPRSRLSCPQPPTEMGCWTSRPRAAYFRPRRAFVQGLLSPLISPSPFPWLWFR